MFKVLAQCALFSFALLPCAAVGEPITLKLAFFSSDRSTSYLAAVKPFVDAVKREIAETDIYTLRRIIPQERGKPWGDR